MPGNLEEPLRQGLVARVQNHTCWASEASAVLGHITFRGLGE
jgi:hypothetical protein